VPDLTECSRCGLPREAAHLKDGVCRFGCPCIECRKGRHHGRGLCIRCLSKYTRLVGLGKTTWAQLEADGKAWPSTRPGNKSTERDRKVVRRLFESMRSKNRRGTSE
jgi:hypothetical protein